MNRGPQTWLSLPPEGAQRIYSFVFDPARYLHPDRARRLLPSGLVSDLGTALIGGLGLDPDPPLDLDRLAHRAALLPPQGLEQLAWFVALRAHAPRLKRVVRRIDLEAFGAALDARDWAFVLAQPTPPASAPLTPAHPDEARSWQALGWRALEAATRELEPGIGARLALKLPLPVMDVQEINPAAALAAVEAVYPACVAAWDPDWDTAWVADATTRIRAEAEVEHV